MLKIRLTVTLLAILASLMFQISKAVAERLVNADSILLCRDAEIQGCFNLFELERFDSMQIIINQELPNNPKKITLKDLKTATVFVWGYQKGNPIIQRLVLKEISGEQYENLLSIILTQGVYSPPGVSMLLDQKTPATIKINSLNLTVTSN